MDFSCDKYYPVSRVTAALGATTDRLRSVSRRRAFVVHLCLSALVVSAVCAIIFFVWYPAPYFDAKGAWGILRVLVGVDLVLGPALTLILFKPRKPGLLFDLGCIAVVQLSALVYGTTIIYQERPYYTVFAVDRFQVLAKDEVELATVPSGRLGDKPFVGPLLVVAVLPQDPQAYQRLLEEVLFEGKLDLDRRPEFWQPYAERSADVIARGTPLETLAQARPDAREEIERFAREDPALIYVPLVGREHDFAFVVDPETATPVGILNVDPWLSGEPGAE